MKPIIFLILFLFAASAYGTNTPITLDPLPQKPPQNKVPAGLIKMGTDDVYSGVVFVADKSRRTLTAWKNENGEPTLLDHFPLDYGKKDGNKQVQGDLKTPEGIYFIRRKKGADELEYNEYGVMAFTLDYPNFFDHMERKTGGGIWLHSIPPTKTLNRGSRGCLVVREHAIKKLDTYLKRYQNSPVIVFERVNYITTADLKKKQDQFNKWLEKWKSAWLSKDIDAYMSFYSNRFYASGRNYKKWRTYKKGIYEASSKIDININNPIIYRNKDQVIIRFLQDYKSDKLADFGEKVLYLKMEQNIPRIVHENWSHTKERPLASVKLSM